MIKVCSSSVSDGISSYIFSIAFVPFISCCLIFFIVCAWIVGVTLFLFPIEVDTLEIGDISGDLIMSVVVQ